jgi:hypothetical protein
LSWDCLSRWQLDPSSPIFPTISKRKPLVNAGGAYAWARDKASGPVDSSNALLTMTVDGQKIAISPEYRVETAVFTDTSPENPSDRIIDSCSGPIEVNACGLAEGSDRIVVADGYFVMLNNLRPGEHTIHLTANVGPNSIEMPYEVTYRIIVE